MTVVGRVAPQAPSPVLGLKARARSLFAMDPLRLSLFLLTVVTVSRIHQHFGILAKMRPALLLFAFATVYALLNRRALATGDLFRTWPAKVVIGLFLLSCVGAPFGLSLGGAATYALFAYSKVIIYALLLMVAIRGVRDLALFVWAYVIASALLLWMALFLFDLKSAYGSNIMRLSNLYTYDANDLGLVLMVGLPLALLLFQTGTRNIKLISGLVVLGIGLTTARTGSRGALVGFIAVGIALLFGLKRVSVVKRAGFVAVLVLGLFVAAPQGYWEQMSTLLNPTQDYNFYDVDGRKAVAKRGMGYMFQYPLFGVGIDNFGKAEAYISDKAKYWVEGTGLRWTAPHNSWVQAGAELGIPGMLLWGGLVLGGAIYSRRLRRRMPPQWEFGDFEQRFLYFSTIYLPISFVAFAVTCTFVSFAYLDPLYILAAFLVGIIRSMNQKLREGPAPQVRASARPAPTFSGRQRLATLPLHLRAGVEPFPRRK
ncbi:MAG TPA: O-antigen ligase family protein [Gemmatimonadaceae bacterium]|nr:O-antigen ligase family protein [Gemmatimonadaceae bacterium]